MSRIPRALLATLLAVPLLGLAPAATASATAVTADRPDAPVRPLPQAHAHNDYEHDRPLQDALSHGFTSVEADVWLVDGELLVAHDREDVDPSRTLESLYLDPLADRARREGGRVYRGYDGVFQLLIDVKSEAGPTYAAVHEALAEHRRIMSTFHDGRVRQDAVTAVISGNRDLPAMQAQRVRYAGYDGRMGDLESGLPASVLPLLSDNWTKYFSWQGIGPMPADQRARLHDIVDRAHATGYRVRFWATPDTPGPARDALWAELLDAGVDHLNTDDLAGLEAFLRARDGAPGHPGMGAPYTMLQMNLCLSGVAGCYGRTAYPAVVDEAVATIIEPGRRGRLAQRGLQRRRRRDRPTDRLPRPLRAGDLPRCRAAVREARGPRRLRQRRAHQGAHRQLAGRRLRGTVRGRGAALDLRDHRTPRDRMLEPPQHPGEPRGAGGQ